ncbi:MAG: erythromycin esterase family protein [Bacteroidaceae bacterium]|nr:erythromycin esterase family protein [Bacteroidaceae bacterium]
MTLDSPKFSLLLFLLNITIGVGAQNIHNLPSKWNDWSQHPKHSFYKIESDTTTSSDGVVLRTRGDWNGIFGTSYPMFNKGKKSLNGEVKIKYKVEKCKKLLLTLHSIGKNADVIKADTIHLPLSENWVEQSYPFSVDCQFLLNVSIEAEGLNKNQSGNVSLAYIDLYSDGVLLDTEVENEALSQVPLSSIKPWDEVLRSPIMEKKILALGETVHGTQTINDMAIELIKERILHHNCKLIFLELPLSLTLYMNRYIHNDPRYTMGHITGKMEHSYSFKLTPLLQWVKDYNAKHGNEISILGIDNEISLIPSTMDLYEFLKEIDTDDVLEPLYYDLMFKLDSANVDTRIVNGMFSEKESKLIQCSINNLRKYQTLHLRLMHRDKDMAETMQWLCDMYLSSDEKATFYGHFMHANYLTLNPAFIHNSPSLGFFLKERYKDDYACLAISATEGEAWFTDNNNNREIYPLQNASVGSIEYYTTNPKNNTKSNIFIEDFNANDVCRIRAMGIFNNTNHFSVWIPQKSMDGIVVINKVAYTDKKIESREKLVLSYWMEIMQELVRKRDSKK